MFVFVFCWIRGFFRVKVFGDGFFFFRVRYIIRLVFVLVFFLFTIKFCFKGIIFKIWSWRFGVFREVLVLIFRVCMLFLIVYVKIFLILIMWVGGLFVVLNEYCVIGVVIERKEKIISSIWVFLFEEVLLVFLVYFWFLRGMIFFVIKNLMVFFF